MKVIGTQVTLPEVEGDEILIIKDEGGLREMTQREKTIREFIDLMDKARFELLHNISGKRGSKAAGRRARKHLTDIKKKITEIKRLTQEV